MTEDDEEPREAPTTTGPIEAGLLRDIDRCDYLEDNPRRESLIAAARRLAGILDSQNLAAPAAVARELRETTEALFGRQADDEDSATDELAAFLGAGSGPVVAGPEVRDPQAV